MTTNLSPEYQSVSEYIRFDGRELTPTSRLILLSLVGHEAPTLQVVYETGACLYAVNKGLAELTKRGLLRRERFALGRFRHTFIGLTKPSWTRNATWRSRRHQGHEGGHSAGRKLAALLRLSLDFHDLRVTSLLETAHGSCTQKGRKVMRTVYTDPSFGRPRS